MNKTLKVIEPFFTMDLNDIFELAEDGNYKAEHCEEFLKHNALGDEFQSSFNSTFTISADYAAKLIADGFLEAVDTEKNENFVNVFDEIDTLLKRYNEDLSSVDPNIPEVLKLEKTTVLKNLIKVLSHLKSLKK